METRSAKARGVGRDERALEPCSAAAHLSSAALCRTLETLLGGSVGWTQGRGVYSESTGTASRVELERRSRRFWIRFLNFMQIGTKRD